MFLLRWIDRRVTHGLLGLATCALSACAGGGMSTVTATASTTSITTTGTTGISSSTTQATSETVGSTSGSGSEGGTTGVLPDPVPCVAEGCVVASDCCESPSHPGTECPGAYPHSWTCEQSVCVHGGCATDADCVIPGFECLVVDGANRCVASCVTDSECKDLHNMPGTLCIGESASADFCLENIPPP